MTDGMNNEYVFFKLECGHTVNRWGNRLILKHLGYLYCDKCHELIEMVKIE